MGVGDILSGTAGLLSDPVIWIVLIVGVIYGIVAGAMPGIGQTLAYGLILPFTFALHPTEGVTLLLATAVGVAYGNSLPAVLIGVPGTPSAVLSALDGYTMSKRGERGVALATQYIAALGGQFVSAIIFVFAVIPLSGLAFIFLPPELFGLYLLGMVAIISLTGKSVLRGIAAACVGIFIGLVGMDPLTNLPRFAPTPDFRTGPRRDRDRDRHSRRQRAVPTDAAGLPVQGRRDGQGAEVSAAVQTPPNLAPDGDRHRDRHLRRRDSRCGRGRRVPAVLPTGEDVLEDTGGVRQRVDRGSCPPTRPRRAQPTPERSSPRSVSASRRQAPRCYCSPR